MVGRKKKHSMNKAEHPTLKPADVILSKYPSSEVNLCLMLSESPLLVVSLLNLTSDVMQVVFSKKSSGNSGFMPV
jgi:hypothetical protein